MDIDPYKCLLASASREHLKRQAELNDRFVGNVFLPAIHRSSRGPIAGGTAASPFRHLKVIEQCIAAENKREEQLAKCQNDSEKRYWTRKFHTQRSYEWKLIQALMLGSTIDANLEIADINSEDSAIALSRSPLNASVHRATTGITAKIPSEDRVFYKAKITGGVPKTKPHLRKKFNLPECQGSPNKVKPYKPHSSKLSDTSPVHLMSLTGDHTASTQSGVAMKTGPRSPSSHRPSRSATSFRVSPVKQNCTEAAKSDDSPKKKHVKPPTRDVPGIRPSKVKLDTEELLEAENVLSFEGPTSFLEAQQIAMAALEEKNSTKCSVKAEKDPVDPVYERASLSASEGDDEQEHCTTSMRTTTTGRPHSSPESRAEFHDASDLDISHSHSTANVASTEFLKVAAFQEYRLVQTAPAEAGERESANANGAADQGTVEAEEGQWESYDEVAEDAISTPLETTSDDGEEKALISDEQHDSEQTDATPEALEDVSIEDDLHVEELGTDEPEAPFRQQSTISAIMVPAVILQTEEDLDDQADMEVAEVLVELVDQLAGDKLGATDAMVVRNNAASTTSSLSASIHIQSAFRGHRARRAFRMALYQEALSCDVLGAMPGSFQGKSGWYQDPKSLMAYYFTILADTGEWKQKIVIRCSRLILTHYQMHEEILSKVFISP